MLHGRPSSMGLDVLQAQDPASFTRALQSSMPSNDYTGSAEVAGADPCNGGRRVWIWPEQRPLAEDPTLRI
jgi:hypothetical protein